MQKNKRMVRALSASALALGLISVATTASAAIATTGIASTRHNLGTSNRTVNGLTTPTGNGNLARDGDLFTNGTDEICVFCHTPHGAVNAATGPTAPLWNKASPNTANYTVYTSGTMQGTSVPGATSMSLACLSCHDGTQAMDNMVNAPGGSGYTAGGAQMAGTWSNTTDTTAGVMQAGAGVVMLGTDLSNDHPIMMKYCGGGAAVGSAAGCSDTDFAAVDSSATGSFFVGAAGQQRNKMRLYGAAVADATVECGSCHDPHNSQTKTFLRTDNAGSAVCLTCHVK